MFCPDCKGEYCEGYFVCAKCETDLVEALPVETEEIEEPTRGYIEYVEVMGTYNVADVALIKSILDSTGITYYFHGEHYSRIDPLIQPACLMVNKDEVEVARTVLKDLKLTITGVSMVSDDD